MRASFFLLSIVMALCMGCWLVPSALASGGNAAPAGAPLELLSDPKGPQAMLLTVIVIGCLCGTVCTAGGAALILVKLWNLVRRKPEPLEIKQPLQTSKADKYVREEDLLHLRADINARFGQVDREVSDIKASLKEQMKRMEDYQHAMRHEMREEMQAIRAAGDQRKEALHEDLNTMQRSYHQAVGKVHQRCDEMVEKIGKLMGQLEIVTSATTGKSR